MIKYSNYYCILVMVLIFCPFISTGQTYIITSTSMNGDITSCLDTVKFNVKIQNPSPYDLTNFEVSILLPKGITYIPTSASNGVTDIDISNMDSIVLSLPNLPKNTDTSFTIALIAGCMTNHSSLKNTLIFSFKGDNGTGGVITASQSFTSPLYNVFYPDLSIVNMTNQSYQGNIGDVFQRCITIVNGGNGALSNFVLKHEHGSGIVVTNHSIGSKTPLPNGVVYTMDSSDFVAVGNGDKFLDPGESVTLCETIEIIYCAFSASNYSYSWGCGGNYCRTKMDAANIVFISETPHLKIERHTNYSLSSTGLGNNCYEDPSGSFESWITITNDGTGVAYNDSFAIGQSISPYGANLIVHSFWSAFNPSSFTIERNGGGKQPLVMDSMAYGNPRFCFSAPLDGVFFHMDSIAPGDTIIIRWNHFTCIPNSCRTATYMLHWRVKGSYDNKCGKKNIIPISGTLPGSVSWPRLAYKVSLDQSPGTLTGNQPQRMSFVTTLRALYIPHNTSKSQFKYRLIIPKDCITVPLSSLVVKDGNGNPVTIPKTIHVSGDTIDLIYNQMFRQGIKFYFDLKKDCNGCAGGAQSIKFQTLYSPDTTCNNWFPMGCESTTIDVICPGSCDSLSIVNATFERINFGLPDNNNNGLPETVGAVDLSKIRTDRLMYGDVAKLANSVHVSNNQNINYEDVVVVHEIAKAGNRMSYVPNSGVVKVYQASTGVYYACNLPTPTINTTGATRKWVYEITLNTLSCTPGLPPGFNLQTGDSIIISCLYENSVGWTGGNGAILPASVTSSVFGTTIDYTDATFPDAEKIYCIKDITRNFTIIGYGFTNSGNQNVKTITGCNEFWMSQNYYLRVGGHYNGNPFPYEYRNWAHPDTFKIIVPLNFDYVAARFRFRRSRGGNSVSYSSWHTITPSLIAGDTYTFNVDPYFGKKGSGATFVYGDAGWVGTFQIKLKPNCAVADSVIKKMSYTWYNDVVSQLSSSSVSTTQSRYHDPILYRAPKLSLQSNLLSVNSKDGQEQWILTVQNSSAVSEANNFWIGAPNTSIISDSLLDVYSNTMLTPNPNGMFAIGKIGTEETRKFILYTTATSCNKDSIRVYAGWNCAPVPNKIASYRCTPLSVLLTITPLMPALETEITQIGGFNAKLCDTLTFRMTVRDYQLGFAFDLLSKAQLPFGLIYVAGSSQLVFKGNTYPIPNPNQTGQSLQWDLSSSAIAPEGLAGLDGTINQTDNFYEIIFKAAPKCGFISGTTMFVSSQGVSYCGSQYNSEIEFSNQIVIDDLKSTYSTSINLGIDYIKPCGKGNDLIVSIVNNGPGTFNNTDSVTITLPVGVTYFPGSYSPLHNGVGISTVPAIKVVGGLQQLTWQLNNTVTAGDSMIFKIDLASNPYQVPCSILEIRAQTSSLTTAQCSVGNNICQVGNVTGQTNKHLFVYKPDFSVSNIFGTLTMDQNGEEWISGQFDLFNQGDTLGKSTPLIIKLYNDVDNNGLYTSVDQLIDSSSMHIIVNAGDTFNYNFSNIKTDSICSLIAVLSLEDNPCFCSSKIFSIPLTLVSTDFYDTICSGEPLVVGNPDFSNYSYLWEYNTNLSDSTIAQPVYSFINSTSNPITKELYRTIIRPGCNMLDTSFITISPIPDGKLIGDTIVCVNDPQPNITFVGSNGEAPYLFYYSINGVAKVATALTDSVEIGIQTSIPNTFTIILDSIQDASPSICGRILKDTAKIIVNPLPQGQILGDKILCVKDPQPKITFVGSHGTAPYTFYYTENGTPKSIIAPVDSVVIQFPTNNPNTYIIVLDSVHDASPSICGQIIKDTVSIIINPLPKGKITPSLQIVCVNSPPPEVVFIGSNGTAPYTFYYKVNGILDSIMTQGDSARMDFPTTIADTFIVTLEGVKDSSPSTCFNTLADTTRIIINPLPKGQILGDKVLCVNDPQPKITFVGSHGTAPYTFYYTENGIPKSIIAPVDSVVIQFPTNSPNTYTIVLDSIHDASPSICSQIRKDTVSIIINPLPKGEIIGSTEVCRDEKAPIVSFEGSNGTAPYTFYYTLNGQQNTIVSSGSKASVSIPTNTPDTFIVILHKITDNSPTSCSRMLHDTVTIIVHPLPEGQLIGGEEICQYDQSPLLTFKGKNGQSFRFDYSINGFSQFLAINSKQESIQVPTDEVGVFIYKLSKVTETTTGCSQLQQDSVVFVIYPKPIADFFFQPKEIKESDNVVTFTNQSVGANAYYWDFDDGSNATLKDPHHQFSTANPAKEYKVKLFVSSKYHCLDTAYRIIKVVEDLLLYVPNSFTPDGDAYNNEFYPVISQGYNLNSYKLVIYNRWGEQIFQTYNINDKWDGNYEGKPCPSGAYVWKIRIRTKKGIGVEKVGHVTLLR